MKENPITSLYKLNSLAIFLCLKQSLTLSTQAGLKLAVIPLSQPYQCWNSSHLPPRTAWYLFFKNNSLEPTTQTQGTRNRPFVLQKGCEHNHGQEAKAEERPVMAPCTRKHMKPSVRRLEQSVRKSLDQRLTFPTRSLIGHLVQ